MVRLGEFVLRHKKWVALLWVVAFIAGMGLAQKATNRLTVDFSLPGQQGYETGKVLNHAYGGSTENGATLIVLKSPNGGPVDQAKVDTVFRGLQQKFPDYRILWAGNAGDSAAAKHFTAKDGSTAYGVAVEKFLTSFTAKQNYTLFKPYLDQQQTATGLQIRTTGYNELSIGDSSGSDSGPSVFVETLFGALGALVVLAFVFASFLALVPLLIAAVAILTCFLCVLAVSYLTDMQFIVQFLIALVGLGLAVDYSLLIVTRWREERDHGRNNHDAVVESMRTAGHAVLSSGATVAISLLALVVVPVPFLRSMGIGGMLIPLVSVAVTLTLLPAMLGSIGPRVDYPKIRHENTASRAWVAWSRMIDRRRWIAAGVGVLILGALVAPVFGIKIGIARTDSLAKHGPAVEALADLRGGGVPAGIVTPLELVVRGDQQAAARAAQAAARADGVAFAVAPQDPAWQRDGTAVALVVPERETVDLTEAQVVDRILHEVEGQPDIVGVAGTGAIVQDYVNAVYKKFPYVMLVIAFVTFLLLVRTFRSILLPAKAVVLNVVSVLAVFGFAVLFWQNGWGSHAVFNIDRTGAITFWVPILIFGFLFGLSMDYEVFILSRMREEYDKSGSTQTAVIQGLGRTGRLVTSAALILFLAFTALAASPGTDVKIIATGLGVGILIDATIVRALLVPALVALFGRWNWWLPPAVARVLRVDPSPLAEEPARVPYPRREEEAAPAAEPAGER